MGSVLSFKDSDGRVLGRDINEILFANPIALNQIRAIIENELMDEEECLLARKMASVTQFNYAKSYFALKSIVAGIDDPRSTVQYST